MLHPQDPPDYTGAEKFMLEKLAAELSPLLSYHGIHHTLDVMQAAMEIAAGENISEREIHLLRVAIAFHDAGFLYTYHGHEEKSCQLVNELLPSYGFNQWQLQSICNMILSTKIPQNPQTSLEQIICDADLDYLGRPDAAIIAATLFEELNTRGNVKDKDQWNATQIRFLQSHRYHTAYSRHHRQPNKEVYLQKLLSK